MGTCLALLGFGENSEAQKLLPRKHNLIRTKGQVVPSTLYLFGRKNCPASSAQRSTPRSMFGTRAWKRHLVHRGSGTGNSTFCSPQACHSLEVERCGKHQGEREYVFSFDLLKCFVCGVFYQGRALSEKTLCFSCRSLDYRPLQNQTYIHRPFLTNDEFLKTSDQPKDGSS